SERSEETLLAQRRELRGLDDEVVRRESELVAARRRHEELTASVEQREAALRDVDTELAQVAVSVVAAEKDLQRSRQEIHDLQEQHRGATGELDDVSRQLATYRDETERLEDQRRVAGDHRDGCAQAVANAEARVRERRDAAIALREAQTSRRITLAE